MAVAEIIGAAIGVLLLVVVAYLLVGGTLSAGEAVAYAQKDLTIQNEARLHTDLFVDADDITRRDTGLNFSVTNTGNEVIADFDHIDVYTFNNSVPYGHQRFVYDKYFQGHAGNWTLLRIDNDNIHPNQLDPGEKAWFWATYTGTVPVWVQVTTGNGVYAQTTFTLT